MKRLLLIALACAACAGRGEAAPPPVDPGLAAIMDDVRGNDWAEASRLAGLRQDRLIGKLVTYFRLLDPGAAGAPEIGAFMAANPDWPAQGALLRAYNAAIAAEPADGLARAECTAQPIITAAAATRCAKALLPVSREQAAGFAQDAWRSGYASAGDAARFFAEWQTMLTPDATWSRFSRFALDGDVAMAKATLPLLGPDRAAIGNAWLAVQSGAANAGALTAALPPQAQATPFLFFASLHAATDPQAELKLWQGLGSAAEAQATGLARALFWPKREALARTLMQQGDAKDAYALVAAATPQSEEKIAGQRFLAGFIALRLLHDPVLAHPWFAALADMSGAVITRARGYYWLAQTEGGAAAAADLARASAFPDTFYGQLAALQRGDTPAALAALIRGVGTPAITPVDAIRFAEREMPQAALLLAEMNAPRRARNFLLRAAEVSPGARDRFLAARLAEGLGLQPAAVMIARLAGADGTMLVGLGWPMPVTPPGPAGPAVVLSITRQESSFAPDVVSASGARGLMQLMPATAHELARKLGLPKPSSVPYTIPGINLQLGSFYLAELTNRFDGCLPLAIAAYNAGPHKVEDWIAQNGDPRLPGTNIVDWIEEIPFAETRNYVQRVVEGIVIYRALRGGDAADPMSRWMKP